MAAVMSPAISIAGIYFMYKGSAYKKERVRWNGSAALVYHHQLASPARPGHLRLGAEGQAFPVAVAAAAAAAAVVAIVTAAA